MAHKKHFLTIFFGLIFSMVFLTSSYAGIYNGDITINSQNSVTSYYTYFVSNGYTGCTGNLNISSSVNLDLTPLNILTSIGGNIVITGNTELTSLNGLENITSVGGALILVANNAKLTNLVISCSSYAGSINIDTNPALTNLSGLENLTSIGNNFVITHNSALTNLDSLKNLKTIGESLYITYNDALTNLGGLENLTSIGGYLDIEHNDVLINLNALESLTSVGGQLNISSLHTLQNLDGLENLTSIGGTAVISYNDALTNFDGLKSLTSIGGPFYVQLNSELTNLNGLANLIFVGGQLAINLNPKLVSFCGLYTLFSTGVWGGINFYNNGYDYPIPGPVAGILAEGPCAPSVTFVALDIQPETCPNTLNVQSKGFIPAAILGTNDLDVQNIDPSSLQLEGISPVRWSIKDVATPISNGEQCDCSTDGADGYADLNLKFDTQELVSALGEVSDGDKLVLNITGNMLDGTPIEGSDCVLIIAKNLGKDLSESLINEPEEYALFENYPNPFNPTTMITYQIPEAGNVELKVYDNLGREVATLVNQYRAAGKYEIEFNATNLTSGIYIYRLITGDFVSIKKMIYLK